MSTSAISTTTPIYDLLVQERGDALAEARTAAHRIHDEARQVLDWSSVRIAAAQREERAFSAFGRSSSGDDDGRVRALPM
ncbi:MULTISPECIES: hypothetical protein [Streptomyces]|uniref:Uncharacterized protein n=1 Tax=Streptomyces cyaneofuscatus TaxID=66883 RepID=A0ABZ1EV05_9ACTN|nr:hypothetical protein [Streptomyces cyaneofuscatus]WSB07906.1 hypothetical protein OG849_11915 [Streptomyces cyaneofuscatus]WSD48561.1 hypothetical protein OG857_23490 [Streptomyces cyaneofuscatus]WTA91969.1 hypothetical protein OG323_24655 [Streptomyces cyaneofuscatus]